MQPKTTPYYLRPFKINLMRLCILILSILFSQSTIAQSVGETEIEVKLFLPTHFKNELKPTDKLEVYFMALEEGVKNPKKVVAKKVRDNVYSFKLAEIKFWHIGFSIGVYRDQMMCVDNREGKAKDDYTFNVHLTKSNQDFSKIQFLPPCVRGDEE